MECHVRIRLTVIIVTKKCRSNRPIISTSDILGNQFHANAITEATNVTKKLAIVRYVDN